MYQGQFFLLKILKFLYGSHSLLFRGCIRFDVVVVHGLLEMKNMQFSEWWKKSFETLLKLKET